MIQIILITIAAFLFSTVGSALFGVWSNVFILSSGAFILAYLGCRRITFSFGIILMLFWEAFLGQPAGNLVVPFVSTFAMFWGFCHFVQVGQFKGAMNSLRNLATFLLLAVLTDIFFVVNSVIWNFVVNEKSEFSFPWLIRDPVGYFVLTLASFLVYLGWLRIFKYV